MADFFFTPHVYSVTVLYVFRFFFYMYIYNIVILFLNNVKRERITIKHCLNDMSITGGPRLNFFVLFVSASTRNLLGPHFHLGNIKQGTTFMISIQFQLRMLAKTKTFNALTRFSF